MHLKQKISNAQLRTNYSDVNHLEPIFFTEISTYAWKLYMPSDKATNVAVIMQSITTNVISLLLHLVAYKVLFEHYCILTFQMNDAPVILPSLPDVWSLMKWYLLNPIRVAKLCINSFDNKDHYGQYLCIHQTQIHAISLYNFAITQIINNWPKMIIRIKFKNSQ